VQSLEDLLEPITTSESVPSKGDGTDERLYIFEVRCQSWFGLPKPAKLPSSIFASFYR
jgi:hypothetical protein